MRTAESPNGALHLFDRAPPADYLREWTERIAAEKMLGETGTNSVIIFRVGVEWLALPTSVFQEVAENCPLHTIPHRCGGIVAGMVTIRGEILLCASLAKLLGLEQTSNGKHLPDQRLLVANRDGNRVAFPVDEVHGVVRYDRRELNSLPAVNHIIGLLSWQERTVGCLDDELLFYTLNKSFA
jgi:chemotaxis-related protein WspD